MPADDFQSIEGLSKILEAIPIPTVVATKDGQITDSNSAAEVLFGLSPNQLRDLQIHQLFITDENGISSLALEISGRSQQLRLDRKVSVINETEIEVFTALPVEKNSDLRQSLDDVRLELFHNKEEIQSFLAVASHDLKSPLRRSKSFIDLISKNYKELLGEKGEDWLSRCSNNLNQMQSLIDDLATFSGINARPSKMADCCLQSIVTEAFAKLKESQFPTAELDILVPLPTMSGDARLMRLLFENLFENALTYNENQVPALSIRCARNGDIWEMSIQDNGMGIEEKHREGVFDFFKRLHPSSRFPGNGLGLTISQRIANHHHGELSLSVNQPGQGSIFILTFPAL